MITENISLINRVVMRGDLRDFGNPKGVLLITRLAQARRD